MSILSSNVKNLLIAQYYHELRNQISYTARASLAAYKGLDGIAGFFGKQASGEAAHAAQVLQFLEDRNECLTVQSVVSPDPIADDLAQWFLTSQTIERDTTEKLKALAGAALEEMDLQTFYWAADLIKEQTEEENIIQTVLDRISSTNNSPCLVHDIDTWIKGL